MLNISAVSDEVTEYSNKWNQRLCEELGDVQRCDLVRVDATRARFEDAIKTYDPSMVIFYDHGSDDALWGSDVRELLDYGNVGTVAGREVYTMACSSGKKLGPEAYRKGCKAFWSYDKPFSFVTSDEEVFGSLANMGLVLKLRKALNWGESVAAVKEEYNRVIEGLKAEGGHGWSVVALINDRDALVCWWSGCEPLSDCPFRRLGIRVFGRMGQKMTKTAAVGVAALFTFYAVALYGYLNLMYDHYGRAVADPGYVGLLGLLCAEFMVVHEYFMALDQR